MKLTSFTISAFTALFLISCSTHPEIKPYESTDAQEEAAPDEQLPYGQSISDSVFSDSTVAYDDSEVPTEFDDSIDMAEESEPPVEAPKKKVAEAKKSTSSRAPASNGKSGMRTFSADCQMKTQPDDASADAGSVNKGKKLWLDQHNATWFKAYKKSGTVYVPSSCVQ